MRQANDANTRLDPMRDVLFEQITGDNWEYVEPKPLIIRVMVLPRSFGPTPTDGDHTERSWPPSSPKIHCPRTPQPSSSATPQSPARNTSVSATKTIRRIESSYAESTAESRNRSRYACTGKLTIRYSRSMTPATTPATRPPPSDSAASLTASRKESPHDPRHLGEPTTLTSITYVHTSKSTPTNCKATAKKISATQSSSQISAWSGRLDEPSSR
jgi:hypothetical protein